MKNVKVHLQNPNRPDGVSMCGMVRYGQNVLDFREYFADKSSPHCNHCDRKYALAHPANLLAQNCPKGGFPRSAGRYASSANAIPCSASAHHSTGCFMSTVDRSNGLTVADSPRPGRGSCGRSLTSAKGGV